MAKKHTGVKKSASRARKRAAKHHKKTHHHVSVIRVKQAKQILLFSVIFFIMGIAIMSYALLTTNESNSGGNTPSTVVIEGASEQYTTVTSKLGYTLEYNTVIDTGTSTVSDGKRFTQPDSERLDIQWQQRPYNTTTITPKDSIEQTRTPDTITDIDASMFKIEVVRPSFVEEVTSEDPEKDPRIAVIESYSPQSISGGSLQYESSLQSIGDVTIGDYEYKEAIFKQDVSIDGIINNSVSYAQKQYIYATEQNGYIYVVTLANIRPGASEESYNRYQSYLEELTFAPPQVEYVVNDTIAPVLGSTTDAIDISGVDLLSNQFGSLLNTVQAQSESNNSTKTVALYEPATVRVINFICMEGTLTIKTSVKLPAACSGGTGTGFIVSEDGYVGTNGHVADIPMSQVLVSQISQGANKEYIAAVANAITGGVNASAVEQRLLSDESYRRDIAVYFQYLPSSYKLEITKETQQLTVELGESNAEINEAAEDPFTDDLFLYNNSVAKATLVESDYNAIDPLSKLETLGDKFTENDYSYSASDVALIKIEDSLKHPVVKLGSIDGLTSGNGLLVIGYPGVAESKGLVAQDKSTPTATQGIVSGIKDAVGSSNKLIQTDATIDQGNSGGPVFNSTGEVIGLATYGIQSTSGGEFNYVRDVKDFIVLADNEKVAYNQGSEVQDIWESGMENYDKRYFSAAIKDFEKVKDLYPPHSQANEYIKQAKERIENGEEASNIGAVILPLAAFLAVAGGIGGIVGVLLHRKHKPAAQAAMAGMAQPQQNQGFGPGQQQPASPYTPPAPQPQYRPQGVSAQPVQQQVPYVQPNTIVPPQQQTSAPAQQKVQAQQQPPQNPPVPPAPSA